MARWEKTGRVPRWTDKLVRLLYMAHAQGNEPIRRAVDRVQTVERLVGQRIVVQAMQGHWEPDGSASERAHAELAA